MVTRILLALVAFRMVFAPAAQEPLPAALLEMAETEREFAAAARVSGIRDAFLTFFSDAAIAFEPGPTSAKDQLRRQKPQPFSARELVWEPRTGDVAASGELGWLTGPGTFVDHASGDHTPRHTNYLSVWRKEPDGRWRVLIDVGTSLDAPAAFAPGFTRFAFDRRYHAQEGRGARASEDKAAAGKSLETADRALNARIAAAGAAAAYREALAPGARVHRRGVGALTDAGEIRRWLDEHAKGLTARTGAAESAIAGDLGYSYGTYEIAASTPGAYLRIWTRDADGRWRVVADVLAPPR